MDMISNDQSAHQYKNSKDFLEAQLKAEYIHLYCSLGMSESEAIAAFQLAFNVAKTAAIKEGTINYPEHYGNILLEKEKTDRILREKLNVLRNDGVKDEDILWWWNLHDIERRMIVFSDNTARIQAFNLDIKNGIDQNEAMAKVKKSFLIYGDPDDASYSASGDDRPLPYELKNRINNFLEKRSHDLMSFKSDLSRYSSINSFIRNEIRIGNL